jgi:hypothetical protein
LKNPLPMQATLKAEKPTFHSKVTTQNQFNFPDTANLKFEIYSLMRISSLYVNSKEVFPGYFKHIHRKYGIKTYT